MGTGRGSKTAWTGRSMHLVLGVGHLHAAFHQLQAQPPQKPAGAWFLGTFDPQEVCRSYQGKASRPLAGQNSRGRSEPSLRRPTLCRGASRLTPAETSWRGQLLTTIN